MFQVGDLAVYPAHGVGVIEKIESQEISGCKQDFYVMRILDNDMIIMIPTTNVDHVGLRDIIPKTELPKLFSILKKRDVTLDSQTWNRRYREYMEKIKTGSVFEVAEVYRDLLILRYDKELSFGERKMLIRLELCWSKKFPWQKRSRNRRWKAIWIACFPSTAEKHISADSHFLFHPRFHLKLKNFDSDRKRPRQPFYPYDCRQ